MTVPATPAKAGPYTGDGVVSAFVFAFPIYADTDLLVIETLIANGAETVLTLNGANGYSVVRNIDQDTNPGGTVTYYQAGTPAPVPVTKLLTIAADFAFEQPTDLPNGGPFFASVVERALDRITSLAKQLKVDSDRSVKVDISSSTTPAELVGELLVASANAVIAAESADADAQATAADRVQTGLDRTQTGQDAQATAADRVQTGLDRTQTGQDAQATAADRVQTGLDRTQTGQDAQTTAADRVQTGQDAQATAADRVQTGLDRASATSSKNSAAADAAAAAASAASVDDTNLLHKTGNETKSGVLTFTDSPVAPDLTDADGTTNVANAKFVQRAIQVSARPSVGEIKARTEDTKRLTAKSLQDIIVSGTAQATTSGTAINFTGFSPYAKKISIPIAKVSTNGTANPILQLGTAVGFVTTGYDSVTSLITSAVFTSLYNNGFGLTSNAQWIASDSASGTFELTLMDAATNTWNVMGTFSIPARPAVMVCTGTLVLGAGAGNILTQARLTTNGGTDTYDAGSANHQVL